MIMNHEHKLRILLVDDHVILRQGLRLMIQAQPDMEIAGETGAAEGLLELVTSHQPDIVLMDIHLSDGNGVQATKKIKESFPLVQVLILTQHQELVFLRQAMKMGASGYILKLSPVETIITAIRTIAASKIYIDPQMKDILVSSYVGRETAMEKMLILDLSEREEEVLRLLAWGKPNREIAKQLGIGIKSVETYRKRAMEKLGLQSRVDIVRYAVERDWLQND
jgi:two-component system, NarL family, response regulator NreC